MVKQEPFSVHDWQKTVRTATEPALARMLKDFAPRFLPDTMVEILPPDAQDTPDVQNLPEEPEEQEPQAEFFTPPGPEEMTPLAGPEKNAGPAAQDIDLDALRQEAFARGEEKQRAQMEEVFSARIAALAETHAAELDAARKDITAEFAAQLEMGLREGLQTIETALSSQLADILVAFAGERLQEKTVRMFAERIATDCIHTKEPLIVEGNRILLEAFQALPDFDASRYYIKPSDSQEIRIVQGETVLSTRIAPLMKELGGII